mmetsp:Transcript_30769/g.99187  ORF Transcript_30769/g.99187 Transcript_30769/m.99187 type:complete len:255 (-) Transcript_30769:473-1237(-)
MSVVLRKAPHAHQPVQSPGPLVPVHRPELRPSQGQITIALRRVLINKAVEGTVHRLELVIVGRRPFTCCCFVFLVFVFFRRVVVFLDFDGVEHAVLVEVDVAAGFPEVEVGDVGSVEDFVALLFVFVLPEVLHGLADLGALGVPEDEAAAGVFLEAEEVELLAEEAVVALFGFLDASLVLDELPRSLPGCAVNSLEHLPRLVPAPVGPGDGLQLHRLGVYGPRRLHVGPRAEVPPLVAEVVDRYGVVLDGLENL